jgi:hypothetical protein
MFRSPSIGLLLSLGLGAAATLAQAGTGLQPPASDTIWPSLQARIAIQSSAGPALGVSALTGPWSAAAQGSGVRGGAVFGDYYFARPAFGSFRATSGLLVGAQGGAPQWSGAASSRLGMALNSSAWPGQPAAEPWATLPYLGVGFTSQAAEGGWSMSADLGLVAENATPGGLRRALGVQGVDNAIRELRLSPVLQLGWRYRF